MTFKASAVCCIFLLCFMHAHAAEYIDNKAIIAAHNKLRTEAGISKPLSYSPALAKSAQRWANQLKRTHHCQIQHSDANRRYGENLYWASPILWSDGRKELRKVTPAEVITSWGEEKMHYDHASNTCATGATCGHYTQIVWHDTSEVGCGMSVCRDSLEQVWVCHYAPAGNISGETPY